MTDLLNIAARLEAACDITGKPIGRHMVPGMTKLGEMQIAMGAKEGDREAGELGEVTACWAACIDNEAKLFDALAIVAKEAVEALRAAAKPLDVKGLAEMLGTSEDDVVFTSTFHQAYDMGAKSHASYSAGYVDAERDIMEYLIDAGETAIREDISRCEHRPQAVSDLLCLRTQMVPEGEPSFECMAYDAHFPSMTVRFQVPTGFPLAGGIFRVQRVRTATLEDTAGFAHLPDAPETL